MKRLIRFLKRQRALHQIELALARGAATAPLRELDPTRPVTWAFSAFSQNGEDGILDYLSRRILNPNRYFIEIGASDGLENNTAWLSIAQRFSGLWIEGDPATSEWCRYVFTPLNYGVEMRCQFVSKANIAAIKTQALFEAPDIFSLDIDGNDWPIMQALLEAGLRPRVCVVEYNSALGPEQSLTMPYLEDYRISRATGDNLYYGCSVTAWRKLFERYGYQFLTVEPNGINAFFIDPRAFDPEFTRALEGLSFAENVAQRREYRTGWEGQFEQIRHRPFDEVS